MFINKSDNLMYISSLYQNAYRISVLLIDITAPVWIQKRWSSSWANRWAWIICM